MRLAFARLPIAVTTACALAVALVFACGGSGDSESAFPPPGPEAGFDASIDGPVFVDPDGSDYLGDPKDLTCFNESTVARCRTCCTGNHAAGYAVFTSALDECACQPSMAGPVCAASQCAKPAQSIPSGDPCLNCFQSAIRTDVEAGATFPANCRIDAGGAVGDYPEKNIASCLPYGRDACKANTECQSRERCAAECSKRVTTGSSDAGSDG